MEKAGEKLREKYSDDDREVEKTLVGVCSETGPAETVEEIDLLVECGAREVH